MEGLTAALLTAMIGCAVVSAADLGLDNESFTRRLLTDGNGSLSSPGHPGFYPDNTDCEWVIRLNPGDRIKTTFLSFDVEFDKVSCRYDFVEVFDGGNSDSPLIGKYCGSSLPQTHVSSTNELFIRFRSDSSHTRRGFIIFYEKDGWQMDEKVANARAEAWEWVQYRLNYTLEDAKRSISRTRQSSEMEKDLSNAFGILMEASDSVLNKWLDPVADTAAELFLEIKDTLNTGPRLDTDEQKMVNNGAARILQMASRFEQEVKTFANKNSIHTANLDNFSPEARSIYFLLKRGWISLLTRHVWPVRHFTEIWAGRMIGGKTGIDDLPKMNLIKAAEKIIRAVDELLETTMNAFGSTAFEFVPLHRSLMIYQIDMSDANTLAQWHSIPLLAQELATKVNEAIDNYNNSISDD